MIRRSQTPGAKYAEGLRTLYTRGRWNAGEKRRLLKKMDAWWKDSTQADRDYAIELDKWLATKWIGYD